MATKLSKKLILVALLGVMGLTACDDDVASYPKGGEILPPSQGQKIYNNELSEIYESIRDGSLASDVLDKLLYEYANTIFGRYCAEAPSYSSNDSNEQTLKAIAQLADDNETKITFVKKHKAYWPNAEVKEDDPDLLATAIQRLNAIYQSVEDRIAKALYDKISGGAYSEHSLFSEKKFLASLYFDGKNVKDYRTAATKPEQILDPDFEAEEVFDHFLTKENYYSEDGKYAYAITENIETIYRELLTEQYVLDESYSTLGRSYARKVNVLSLTVDSDSKQDVPALANYIIDHIIAGKAADELRLVVPAADRHGEETVETLFNQIGKIMQGLPEYFGANTFQTKVVTALNDASEDVFGDPAEFAGDPDFFLTSTAYGSMMKDYSKITDNLVTTDSSIESSFTGSGAYTKELGKVYKEREIALKSYTTKGWQLKNGGLSSLPESIRNRLFNLSVASALDSEELKDRRLDVDWEDETHDYYKEEMGVNKYVAKVNGAYFLKAETVEDKKSNRDLYFFDSSSNTYYFVQIVEAVNPAKLSTGGDGRYAALVNEKLQETIAREVCEQVAKISSYSGLAKDHWLKEMSLQYHDTKIYDYFKSNYPDLFD